MNFLILFGTMLKDLAVWKSRISMTLVILEHYCKGIVVQLSGPTASWTLLNQLG